MVGFLEGAKSYCNQCTVTRNKVAPETEWCPLKNSKRQKFQQKKDISRSEILHGINSLKAYWLPPCWENVSVVLSSRVQLYQVTQVTRSVWTTHQNWNKRLIIFPFQAILCKLIVLLQWAISVVIKQVCFYLFQAEQNCSLLIVVPKKPWHTSRSWHL